MVRDSFLGEELNLFQLLLKFKRECRSDHEILALLYRD